MIDRRTFLKTTGATLAATASAVPAPSASAAASSPWHKAFLLGVIKGPILPHFERLNEVGGRGPGR